MQQVQAQVTVISDELTLLKNEMIQMKAAHANMHQAAVEQGSTSAQRHTEQSQRMQSVEEKFDRLSTQIRSGGSSYDGGKRQHLIEPKQITVEEFAGSLTDSRSRFIEWSERVKDRCLLYEESVVEAMNKVENQSEPVTKEMSITMGVSMEASKELNCFLMVF